MQAVPLLLPLFAITALLYASAGFGGGSTYLALLVLTDVPFADVPQIALCCNLLVVSGGVYHAARGGHLSWRRVWPFVVGSVPCAYLGGTIPVSQDLFLILLCGALATVGVYMLFQPKADATLTPGSGSSAVVWPCRRPLAVAAGAGIGLLSGMVGIGGGIFLAPLMHLLGWGTSRQIAASSSGFILLNSLAGLGGQFRRAPLAVDPAMLMALLVAVLVGGQIGSQWSMGRLGAQGIRRVTAALVLMAAGRLAWRWV